MTSGYILIVAVLVLGGLLATLGDRIGTKVGKARLSLFNLRPRNTAIVVTIITGSLISASTLGILFASSASLRKGIFELDSIQKKLRIARDEVRVLNAQKGHIENELTKTRTEQAEVQQRLNVTNKNFQQARTQLKNISQQATVLRSEVKSLLAERQELIEQRNQLNQQITQLKSQVNQLKESVAQRDQELVKRGQTINERNQELAKKDEEIAQREARLKELEQQFREAIAQREARFREVEQQFKEVLVQREARFKEREQQLREAIAEREKRLQDLEEQLVYKKIQVAERDQQLDEREKQLSFLERRVEDLEQYYQNYQVLRSGNLALVRGQVLSFGVVRIVDPSVANQAVDQLLREANRAASEATRSSNRNSGEPLVKIPQTQVDQLINQIQDGKDYVVRIISVGNYVVGEKEIQVFADAALNQIVFEAGDVLAAVSTDSSTMTNEQIQQRLEQVVAASRFRARRAGVLGVIQVGDGSAATVVRFIEQLAKSKEPLDVKAVAQETTYTAGPLKMQLVATKNGQVIFST
ncbi:MAG TPA: DUF3084 domain-containing protein [Coleofasciculaceae cyanobacterium]|jgi:uncharacterized protein (DUF3084 family)